MCDEYNIVCTATIFNKLSDIKRLAKAIVAIVELSADNKSEREFLTRNPVYNLKIIPRDAYFSDGELVSVEESLGRISKNVISRNNAPMILVPGEEITESHIKVMMGLKGGVNLGIRENGLIEVVKKSWF